MNILIITTVFYPTNHIGSFRMNAFAKYFRQAGHEVTVIAEGAEDKTEQWEGCKVHYVKDPIIPQYTKKSYQSALGKKWTLRRILKALEFRITLNTSYFWSLKVERIAKHLFNDKQIDLVLSTYSYDMPSHFCTLKLRKKGFKFYWIADFRDELHYPKISWHIKKLYLGRLKSLIQQVLNMSDLILSVSKPIVEDLRASSAHSHVLEIRNGYDYPEVYDCNFQEHFTMTYLGHFYKNIHPDNWFKAYAELIDEGILPDDGKIKIVGNHEPIEIPEAIRKNVVEIPIVPHDEAIRISIYETDVLVMIYSDITGRKGVYSGKLLDYLATNKPIIAMYDPDEVIGKLMNETKAGFVVRYDDIPSIKNAIMKCFHLWENREVLPRNWDKIKEYRRSHQVGLLINYLKENINIS